MNSRTALIKSGSFCHSAIWSYKSFFSFLDFALAISLNKENLIYKSFVIDNEKSGDGVCTFDFKQFVCCYTPLTRKQWGCF